MKVKKMEDLNKLIFDNEVPEIEPKSKLTLKDLCIVLGILGLIVILILGIQAYETQLENYYVQGQVDLYRNIFGIKQCKIIPNITIQINSTTSVPISLVDCLK